MLVLRQPWQEKQQVPAQQALPRLLLGVWQQSALLVHPLAPAGTRQMPAQHDCPTQQSLLPLH